MTKPEGRMARHLEAQVEHERNVARGERRRVLQAARKQLNQTTNRASSRPRERRFDVNDDEDGEETFERIMPRDLRDRRKAVAKAAFRTPAQTAGVEQPVPADDLPDGLRGRVVESGSGLCRVLQGERTLLCKIRGALKKADQISTNLIAVGDEVIVEDDGYGGGVVIAVLPRRGVLARPDSFSPHLRQVLVANADQLLIVAAWREPQIWLELIDRYLIAAERCGLPAVICINKIDLVEDVPECARTLQPYQDLGYRVLLTSALTGMGIADLQELLAGSTTVLTGLSGVGKSSLVSAAEPGLDLRTGAVSMSHTATGEGRHTTTQATLHPLAAGGAVVDTPGIREWGLGGMQRHELADFFPEIAEYAPDCRFNNCAHLTEQGCAVLAAVAHGAIATSRAHSYRQIYAALPA